MIGSVVDLPALLLALGVSLAVAAGLLLGTEGRSGRRRWLGAGAMAALLMVAGLLDLSRETPRETHWATVVVGATLGVLGGLGATVATRRLRRWLAWPVVFAATLVALFVGVLVGATVLPRYLPF